MRSFLRDCWPFILGVAFVLFLTALLASEFLIASEEIVEGKVVAKHFSPQEVHHGTGVAVGSKGESVVVSTVSVSDEVWTIVVETREGVCSAKSHPNTWGSVRIGDDIDVGIRTGWLFGSKSFVAYKKIPGGGQ